MKEIRNFSIIAHIDHGKSTLSDRFIQICCNLNKREMKKQILDSMDLERERGITIKAQTVNLNYKSKNGKLYKLNLIDTPGHVDFSYEVYRSLLACEGALLLIDASKGVQSQTISNYILSKKMNLTIIPVINKIDLNILNINSVIKDIKNIVSKNDFNNIIKCSAKTGKGVKNIFEKIINIIPSPKGDNKKPLQAIIIDSWFNNYLGVVLLIKIKNGYLKKNDKIKIINNFNNKSFIVYKLGIFTPKSIEVSILNCGEVGWIICNIKKINSIKIGDTITLFKNILIKKLPNLKKINPKIYIGLFPVNQNCFNLFKSALLKLNLNDYSFTFEIEKSFILGFGFRCGFLGMLHMDIIIERLKREYNLNLIITSPTVIYKIIKKNNDIIYVDNPIKYPNLNEISCIKEPIAECHIILNKDYLGKIIKLCNEKRGIQKKINFNKNKIYLIYDIPINEIILNFFDKLKSISCGYASLDFFFKKFKTSNIVKIDILINNKIIDVLSLITHKKNSIYFCLKFIKKLKKIIPRQQYNINLQAAIGKKIITKSVIKQLRKNVISKCYGGDISRKNKLLKKQKKGKKKMKKFGNLNIPKEAFFSILKIK